MADVITRFKLETTQFDSKLRDSAKSLADLTDKLMIAGKDFDRFASKNVEAAKALGNIAPSANNAKDKVKELVNAYNDVSKAYNKLTVEQKNTDYGKALAGSLAQLKGKVTDAKQELYGLGDAMEKSKNAGIDFNSVLASLGQRFGINSELMGVLTSGTLATTAAVTAGAAAVAAATKMWADYNDELNRQTNVTTVTTGLKGDDAENLTIGVRALAKTYDVDFREAINAANTLIQQFGVSGEQALSLLQDGMQGMIAGDGGKLLSMIQQYAPSFRDAGIEASQLVAVIQNSEGGLFTDQNMQAIVMGIRNIRLMTKQTSDALAQLGIDGQEMSRKLEDGSMTIFDALRQVSDAIDNVGSGSKAAGEVMQAVFGRQGTMAGTKLGEAIATLNTNLEETKTQTGEVGENLRKVNEKTEELERSLQQVFQTARWDEWATSLKVFALEGLTFTVDWIGKAKELNEQWNIAYITLNKIATALGLIDGKTPQGAGSSTPSPSKSSSKPASTYTETVDSRGNVVRATRNGQDVTDEVQKIKSKTNVTTTTPTSRTSSGIKKETWAPIAMQALGGLSFGRSVNDVQADISRAQKAYNNAEDAAGRAAAQTMLDKRTAELASIKNEGNLFADAYAYNFGKVKIEEKKPSNEEKEYEFNEVETFQKFISGLTQVSSGLQQMGVKLPDGVQKVLGFGQGLISVIQGVQSVITLVNTTMSASQLTAETANTTALVANTAAMVSLTTAIGVNSAVSAIPFFAHGGLVGKAAGGLLIPGNSYSGDNLRMPVFGGGMIGVNSGELILNRSQQDVLAEQLTTDNGGAIGTPFVDGERIFLGVNNFLRRSGKGEIVTSRR